jgi:hypothetical protein
MEFKKLGKVVNFQNQNQMWATHFMAPAPVLLDSATIRIFVGGWDQYKISRIWFVDVKIDNPLKIIHSSPNPILDIGKDGCFDENGVFPAHIYKFSDKKSYLYYTGFQLGHKIRHYNFGGLATSSDNNTTFDRYSQAPILDRADEGLFVRAGQSLEMGENGEYLSVYSAGSSWFPCEGELRPIYDVYFQQSKDGIYLENKGQQILKADLSVEHGLGRPQIIKLGKFYYVFYTRRIIKDMRYFLGAARSSDLNNWERVDHLFENISFGGPGEFDSEMVYFPGVVKVSENKAFMFYSGNYFGRDGMGVVEVTF